jgi:biopolymer transport protein ExbB
MSPIVFVVLGAGSSIAALGIYQFMLPDYIKLGGFLVPVIIALSIVALALIAERLITLRRVRGAGAPRAFAEELQGSLKERDVPRAIEACRRQGGSLANVVGAGLERFHATSSRGGAVDYRMMETRRAIQEANALEMPVLERNLIALSTIASIATMIGLLGTVIGMIRSFRAMATVGAPDAIQLATGISEALINTAGGLFLAIVAIVAYNWFTARAEAFSHVIEETAFDVLDTLSSQLEESRGGAA